MILKTTNICLQTLSKTARNYSKSEKKFLAIVYGMKKYLLGKYFFVYTDHKPLLGLFPETKGIQLMAVL